MFNSNELEKKWQPILEAADAPKFADNHRKAVTTVLLENQQKALDEENGQASFLNEAAPSMNTGTNGSPVAAWDPVLISLVRRSMPNLIAFDVAGVQPMNGPTGLIFAMKSKYGVGGYTETSDFATKAEALFDNIDADYSGPTTTLASEGDSFNDMGFTVDKVAVTAKTRQLKAEYTMELAQDLKALHGLDAETELANILSTEILAEINQEMIGGINTTAVIGGNAGVTSYTVSTATGAAATGQPIGTVLGAEERVASSTTLTAIITNTAATDTATAQDIFDAETRPNGEFDLQGADGRWAEEKFRSLLFQIELEANAIAKGTRRGKGNFLICSSNVASALAAAGVMTYAPDLMNQLEVDSTGNTFAGTINGRMKVYVDPYALSDYATVGFRGTNSYDAGIFYCPYVPLTMIKAQAEQSLQPKIAFKTRYGMAVNPYAATGEDASILTAERANNYFRTFKVTNIFDTVTPQN